MQTKSMNFGIVKYSGDPKIQNNWWKKFWIRDDPRTTEIQENPIFIVNGRFIGESDLIQYLQKSKEILNYERSKNDPFHYLQFWIMRNPNITEIQENPFYPTCSTIQGNPFLINGSWIVTNPSDPFPLFAILDYHGYQIHLSVFGILDHQKSKIFYCSNNPLISLFWNSK